MFRWNRASLDQKRYDNQSLLGQDKCVELWYCTLLAKTNVFFVQTFNFIFLTMIINLSCLINVYGKDKIVSGFFHLNNPRPQFLLSDIFWCPSHRYLRWLTFQGWMSLDQASAEGRCELLRSGRQCAFPLGHGCCQGMYPQRTLSGAWKQRVKGMATHFHDKGLRLR